MPNLWNAVDSNLPDLSRVSDPKAQILLLFNYLVELTEQLRYSLNNLSASNWNTASLSQLKETINEDTLLAVKQLDGRVISLASSVNAVGGRVTSAETEIMFLKLWKETTDEDIAGLQGNLSDAEGALEKLDAEIFGENGIKKQVEDLQAAIDELRQDLDGVASRIRQTEDGTEIGEEGKTLRLKGTVYINGVLLEQRGATE